MNPEVKKMWVEALRSGEYQQTDAVLRDERGFCCLGVLCQLHANESGISWRKGFVGDEYIGSEAVLPAVVMEWADLADNNGARVTINGKREYLTEHNDTGRTFAEIANAIEEQL